MTDTLQPPAVARLAEVHRLAVAGGEAAIARDVCRQVAPVWLRTSRFAAVEALTSATLTLGPDADAFYHRGWARNATGRPRLALADYEASIPLRRAAGDRTGEAIALNNIGSASGGLGDVAQALDHFRRALTILRATGDRAGEAAGLNNLGRAYAELGDHEQALAHYREVLSLTREIGYRAGEANALNSIGVTYEGLGEYDRALAGYERALAVRLEIGDRAGADVVRSNLVRALRAKSGRGPAG